ncbi:MAG: hypothetical protein ACXVZ2_02310 [Gaiellaceae bacterium]
MGVFNRKNAIIGWAVVEAARIAARCRNAEAEAAAAEEKPKKHYVAKGLAAATGAVVAVGCVAALRRRKGAKGTEEEV